jgi:hypothetical protein
MYRGFPVGYLLFWSTVPFRTLFRFLDNKGLQRETAPGLRPEAFSSARVRGDDPSLYAHRIVRFVHVFHAARRVARLHLGLGMSRCIVASFFFVASVILAILSSTCFI